MKMVHSQENKEPSPAPFFLQSLYEFGPQRVLRALENGASSAIHNRGQIAVALGMLVNGVAIGYFLSQDYSQRASVLSQMNLQQTMLNGDFSYVNSRIVKQEAELNRLLEYVINYTQAGLCVSVIFVTEMFSKRILNI